MNASSRECLLIGWIEIQPCGQYLDSGTQLLTAILYSFGLCMSNNSFTRHGYSIIEAGI